MGIGVILPRSWTGCPKGADGDRGSAGEAMPKRSTLKLTKRIVEKLKAEDKDAIYWDGELTGFVIYDLILLI